MGSSNPSHLIWSNGCWCWTAIALGIGCLPMPPEPGLDRPVIVVSGFKPAALELDQLPWEPGLSERYWNVATQGQRSGEVWIPEASRPRSVVVLLHPAIVKYPARGGTDPRSMARGLIKCLAVPALAALDPLIIAPHSPDGQWWKKADTEFVLGLSTAARQRWPELTTRSVIMGFSNGGIATWYLARLYPTYFSAAIPIAFDASIVGPSPLPIYAIQGESDELFSIEGVRAAINTVKAQGSDVTFNERYRAKHIDVCAYSSELAMAGQWLEQHAFPKAQRSAAASEKTRRLSLPETGPQRNP